MKFNQFPKPKFHFHQGHGPGVLLSLLAVLASGQVLVFFLIQILLRRQNNMIWVQIFHFQNAAPADTCCSRWSDPGALSNEKHKIPLHDGLQGFTFPNFVQILHLQSCGIIIIVIVVVKNQNSKLKMATFWKILSKAIDGTGR